MKFRGEHSQFVPGRRRAGIGAFLSRFTKPLCKFQILLEFRHRPSRWLNAAEVGFLVVKPFKKHTFLASGINGGQTGNAPISGCFYKILVPSSGVFRFLYPAFGGFYIVMGCLLVLIIRHEMSVL